MSVWEKMNNAIRNGIRSYLRIEPAQTRAITITETFDYVSNAAKNRIWYRGDSAELSQLYDQMPGTVSERQRFWAARSSAGQELRKIHTGLPALMVNVLTNVTIADMAISLEGGENEDIWENIAKENRMKKLLEKAVNETLYVGDGAFKISFDADISQYPILEFYPGDRVGLDIRRGRIREVIFKTTYSHGFSDYVLEEHYGFGYIRNVLTQNGSPVDLGSIPETKDMERGWEFGSEDDRYMMAVPVSFFSSPKWPGRGRSVFDSKIDSFDSLDEAWSQWMDALRAGRAHTYIPENLIPRDPTNGAVMTPNPFDNRYIRTSADMAEGAKNEVRTEQPSIPHESYLSTYTTALGLCLQGIISPSTLGIDVKKLDNAEAQREKEKTTLYTRGEIVDALQTDIPELVRAAVMAYRDFHSMPAVKVSATVEFGDYANPSFEATVETISKARQGGVMSIEASVDELYGDDKDDAWKREEVARLKAEQGVAELSEPAVNTALGDFTVDLEDDDGADDGEDR